MPYGYRVHHIGHCGNGGVVMEKPQRIKTCLRCTGGRVVCPHDGKDIILDHVNLHLCQIGKYGDIKEIPQDTTPEIEQRRARAGGCCGKPSKTE